MSLKSTKKIGKLISVLVTLAILISVVTVPASATPYWAWLGTEVHQEIATKFKAENSFWADTSMCLTVPIKGTSPALKPDLVKDWSFYSGYWGQSEIYEIKPISYYINPNLKSAKDQLNSYKTAYTKNYGDITSSGVSWDPNGRIMYLPKNNAIAVVYTEYYSNNYDKAGLIFYNAVNYKNRPSLAVQKVNEKIKDKNGIQYTCLAKQIVTAPNKTNTTLALVKDASGNLLTGAIVGGVIVLGAVALISGGWAVAGTAAAVSVLAVFVADSIKYDSTISGGV